MEVNSLESESVKLGESLYVPMQDLKIEGSKGSKLRSKSEVREGEHLVRPGETLYSLSRKYGVAEQELLVEVETIYVEAAKAALDAELANQSNKTEE